MDYDYNDNYGDDGNVDFVDVVSKLSIDELNSIALPASNIVRIKVTANLYLIVEINLIFSLQRRCRALKALITLIFCSGKEGFFTRL